MSRHAASWLPLLVAVGLIWQGGLPILPARAAPAILAAETPPAPPAQVEAEVAAEAKPPALNLDLNLNLTSDPPWAAPGEVVTFTVTTSNPAALALPALVVTATLPDGQRYVAGSAAGFTDDHAALALTWPRAR